MTRPMPRARGRHGVLALALAAAACAPHSVQVTPARRAAADAQARAAVAAEAGRDVASIPARTLAVTPFAISMRDTALAPLAYGLADLLTTDLARSSQLQLVDRIALDATLRELRLVETGRVDPATAPRVGRVVGARRLIVGSLAQPDGRTLGIQARVADVATTELQRNVAATAPIDDILRAEKELAFRIFDALGVRLTPAERVAVEQRQTQNLAALLAFGRGVRYELEGRLDPAAESYIAALRQDPGFQRAAERLTAIRPNLLGLSRALDGAAGRLNGTFYLPTLGSSTDPAFFPTSVTFILTVTTTPP